MNQLNIFLSNILNIKYGGSIGAFLKINDSGIKIEQGFMEIQGKTRFLLVYNFIDAVIKKNIHTKGILRIPEKVFFTRNKQLPYKFSFNSLLFNKCKENAIQQGFQIELILKENAWVEELDTEIKRKYE